MLNTVDVGESKTFLGGFRLHDWLLLIWFVASFGVVFFARDLQMMVRGWPLGY
jgi:cation/acetate symporter